MRLKNLLLLLTTGEVKNIVWYEELTANDNELVFQVDEHLTNKNLFGTNASTTYHPSSAYSVYINDSLTDQTFDNITCLRGDVVKIVANGVDSFPKFDRTYNSPISCIAKFPPLTTSLGYGVATIDEVFYGAGMLRTVPDDLFVNNTQVTTLDGTFQHSYFQEIPTSLFEPLSDLSSLQAPFWGCSHITSIPTNLFASNYKLLDLYGCFAYTNITEIPENLFQMNTRLSRCSSTFAGTKITTIPSELFSSSSNLTNIDTCFQRCKNLTNIPSNLFSNCANLKYIGRTRTVSEEYRQYFGVFAECTSLTSVPEGLFDNNTLIEDFNGCFNGCTALILVPENLFANNTAVTSFHSTFYGCTHLSGRLKIGSSKVTDASRFCEGAGAITVVVPAGSTTETTFRAIAETLTNLTVETY